MSVSARSIGGMTKRSRGGLCVSRTTPKPPALCTACAGSGYYDDTDRRGRPVICGSCQGSGSDQ